LTGLVRGHSGGDYSLVRLGFKRACIGSCWSEKFYKMKNRSAVYGDMPIKKIEFIRRFPFALIIYPFKMRIRMVK
jgi:hypothetical protein